MHILMGQIMEMIHVKTDIVVTIKMAPRGFVLMSMLEEGTVYHILVLWWFLPTLIALIVNKWAITLTTARTRRILWWLLQILMTIKARR